MTTTTDRPTITTKGSLIAALVVGDVVQLWYASPTGDATDSQIHDIQCASHEQAIAVSKLHRAVWGV